MADEQPSPTRDQFIADVAVKLERLRSAIGIFETALSRFREDQQATADKVDLILDGRCGDLEMRASSLEAQVKKLDGDIVGLQDEVRRLSDPTQKVSYNAHEMLTQLGQRVDKLERHGSARLGSARALCLATALIVIFGAVIFVGLK